MLISALFCTLISFRVANWIVHDTGSFRIEFPSGPKTDSQFVETALGNMTMHIAMQEFSGEDGNFLFGAISSKYPESMIHSDKKDIIDQFFDGSVEGVVSNVKGKLISDNKTELHGFPGRDIKVDFQDGLAVIRCRIYLVRNELIMIQSITTPDKQDNDGVRKFHDSFKLK